MNYFLGIDGGGTKTKAVCINDNFKVISSIESGASNPLAIGYTKAADRLIELIQKFTEKRKISFCLMGIAGCGRNENIQKLKKILIQKSKSQKIILPNFEIVSDIEIAHEAAFNGREGVILIIGTGSILFYKNKNKEKLIIGGYGKLIGDEGSGYSIGKKSLQILSKVLDGRLKSSLLTDTLKEKFSINNRDRLIDYIYNNKIEISQATKYVLKAAEKKDKYAISILNDAANEVILHLEAAKKILKKNFNLCLLGSLVTNENYYSRLIKEKIKENLNGIKLVKPKYSPETGAAILSKKIYSQFPKQL
ncbi:MAG: hypothetical protein N2249_08020 [Melioribacter sp.]|nr:hypothetical protein [Melioribacter sp.]